MTAAVFSFSHLVEVLGGEWESRCLTLTLEEKGSEDDELRTNKKSCCLCFPAQQRDPTKVPYEGEHNILGYWALSPPLLAY